MTYKRREELRQLQYKIFEEDDDSQSVIGYIDFSIKDKVKDVVCVVRMKEGSENPHIHLLNENFRCSIRLDKPEYYDHDEFTDRLENIWQVRKFDLFMKSYWITDDPEFTHWDFATTQYDLGFEYKIKWDPDKQPNYTLLIDK